MLFWLLFMVLVLAVLVVLVLVVAPSTTQKKDEFATSPPTTFRDHFQTLEYGSLKNKFTFRAYDELFGRFRGHRPVILEIGVRGGGGTELFYKYFGDECEVFGVDIEERVKRIQKKYPQTPIFIGDQADPEFMKHVAESIGKPIDIVLDDGGHFMHQQIRSFEAIFPFVRNGGVYVIEDVQTSYNDQFNNHTTPTLVEYMKEKADGVILGNPENIQSIQFYKDMVAVQKDHDIPFGFMYKDKTMDTHKEVENLDDAPDPFDVSYEM